MDNIRDFLTHDHRACDEVFAQMEQKASEDLSAAKELVEQFVADMEKHFQMEERVCLLNLKQKQG